MRKLFILWRNEMARVAKRTFVLVMALVMIALSFLACGGLKLIEKLYGNSDDLFIRDDAAMIDSYIKENSDTLAGILTRLEEDADDPEALADLSATSVQLEYYKALKEFDIPLYSYNGFTRSCANALSTYRTYRAYPQLASRLAKDDVEKMCTAYESALRNHDYKQYTEARKTDLELNQQESGMTDRELEIEKKAIDYTYMLNEKDPDASSEYNADVEGWKEAENALFTGKYMDANGQYLPINDQLREKYKNKKAVYEYKFEHKMSSGDLNSPSGLSLAFAKGLCSSFLLFLLLILAGSSVATDIQTGSIKGLIIAPAKRSKIFFAKVLSLIAIALIGTLVCTVVATAAHSLFFGFSSLPAYVYATGGTAHVLPGVIYLLAQMAADLIPLMLFISFALMLSTLTRNTAVAVGVSIAAYYVSGIAASVLQLGVITGEWIKFLPFLHIDVPSALFPFASNDAMMGMGTVGVSLTPSVTFSLVYIAVAVFTLGYMAFDSFTRRDI